MTTDTERRMLGLMVVAGVALAAACGAEADGSDEARAAPAAAAATAAAPLPDTTGAAMWAHLQGEDYQTEWELWPDKGRLYEGQQPHGARLTTYLNDIAYEALMSDAGTFPPGAVVVKENYTPDGTLAAVTTMFKRPGYNAEHNDWFFTKHLADGSLDRAPNGMELEGRLPGCQGCHIAKADNDYIFTSELSR